jgi:hypothetical protein
MITIIVGTCRKDAQIARPITQHDLSGCVVPLMVLEWAELGHKAVGSDSHVHILLTSAVLCSVMLFTRPRIGCRVCTDIDSDQARLLTAEQPAGQGTSLEFLFSLYNFVLYGL